MTAWAGMCGAVPRAIALVDDSGDRPRLRYVFDIFRHRHAGTFPHPPGYGSCDERHIEPVSAMLERNYDVGSNDPGPATG